MANLIVDWTWTPVSIVAVYAAIVSTALLAVNAISLIVGLRRESPGIKLSLRWSVIVSPGRERLGPYFSFDISNVGRRTITIAEFGYRTGRLLLHINPYNPLFPALSAQELPFELTEGKNKSLFVVPEIAFEKIKQEISSPPKKAYVRDAVGRYFMCGVPTNMRDKIWGDASYRPWWKFWEQGWWPL